jgi:DNA-binding CsgD family transcriptional regulator
LLTYEQQWVDRYIARDYFRIDPVVSRGRTGFLPIDWLEIDRSTPEAHRFFAEAESYGVGCNGVSLPIRGPSGERAIFTGTAYASDREWLARRIALFRDLQFIAHYVHDRVMRVVGIAPSTPSRPLSSRELECLQLISRGRTAKGIAWDIGVSDTAVRLYLSSARTKLRCATVSQAVGVAIAMNIISP